MSTNDRISHHKAQITELKRQLLSEQRCSAEYKRQLDEYEQECRKAGFAMHLTSLSYKMWKLNNIVEEKTKELEKCKAAYNARTLQVAILSIVLVLITAIYIYYSYRMTH